MTKKTLQFFNKFNPIKFILFAATVYLSQLTIAYAEHCPRIEDIKTNHALTWEILDSIDHQPLSRHRLAKFKAALTGFMLAELPLNQNGKIRCFYKDKAGSDMEAYLEKSHRNLHTKALPWYQVSGAMQCTATLETCKFYKTNAKQMELLHV